MGEVVAYQPKSLIEFEESAARVVAIGSRFLTDVPAVIRVANLLRDENLVERVCNLIIPLSALVQSVGILEEYAPAIVEHIPPNEKLIVHVENAGEAHNVLCHAEIRENIIHVRKFELRPRPWLDRLTQAEPQLLIEYRG